MKCDNCGKEEVNFHFTSDINGNITEKHLCTDCAGKLGFTDGSIDGSEPSFEEVFAELFGARPNRRMLGGFGLVFPTFVIPLIGVQAANNGYDEADTTQSVKPVEIKPEIDVEMQRRREVNILREQMKKAAVEENFEKAAAIRDNIRKLEIGDNS